MKQLLDEAREGHRKALDAFVDREPAGLEALSRAVAEALDAGGKLLAFGNGGSAAQAQELAAECVNRLRLPRRALAAVALTADGPVMTSIGNDVEFAEIFARQLSALGRPGDIALALSTSGASPNVVRALDAGRKAGLVTAGLLGNGGGEAASFCDHAVVVDASETARVQEVHLFAIHLLCARVESLLGIA